MSTYSRWEIGLLDCIPVVYYYSTSAGFARSGACKLGENSLVRLVAGNLKGRLTLFDSRGDNRNEVSNMMYSWGGVGHIFQKEERGNYIDRIKLGYETTVRREQEIYICYRLGAWAWGREGLWEKRVQGKSEVYETTRSKGPGSRIHWRRHMREE